MASYIIEIVPRILQGTCVLRKFSCMSVEICPRVCGNSWGITVFCTLWPVAVCPNLRRHVLEIMKYSYHGRHDNDDNNKSNNNTPQCNSPAVGQQFIQLYTQVRRLCLEKEWIQNVEWVCVAMSKNSHPSSGYRDEVDIHRPVRLSIVGYSWTQTRIPVESTLMHTKFGSSCRLFKSAQRTRQAASAR